RASEPSDPRGVEVTDDGGPCDARAHHHRRQLAETAQRVAPREGQERRRLVEGAEAGHAERELPPVLVPGADQREGDEAAEEGDVGRAAVGQKMERAEESDRHDEGVARDAVHAPRGRIAGHDPGGARPDEARHQHHEREPHADVHRPVEPRAPRHEPEPPPGVLVREEGPYERDEEGERHQRVEPAERVLAGARGRGRASRSHPRPTPWSTSARSTPRSASRCPTPRRTTSPAWLSTPSRAASSGATWRSASCASSGASPPRGSGSWCGTATARSGCSNVSGRSCPTR